MKLCDGNGSALQMMLLLKYKEILVLNSKAHFYSSSIYSLASDLEKIELGFKFYLT